MLTHPVVKLSFLFRYGIRLPVWSAIEMLWSLFHFSPFADLDSLEDPSIPKTKTWWWQKCKLVCECAGHQNTKLSEILDLGSEIGFEIDTLRLEFPVWKYTVEKSQSSAARFEIDALRLEFTTIDENWDLRNFMKQIFLNLRNLWSLDPCVDFILRALRPRDAPCMKV